MPQVPSLMKLPPQNLEAEESILSACLIYPESCDEIVDLLRPEHFYKSAHVKIFSAIIELNSKKQPVDLVTISNLLRSMGCLEEIGGASYLSSLITEVPAAVNIIHYAEIVRDKAAKRLTIKHCNDISQSCFADSDPATEIIDVAQNKILSIEINNPGKLTYQPSSEIILDCIEVLDERFLNKGKITGIPTGFSYIDELLWGLQKTDLIILAARPSQGKSSLAINITRHAAIDCEEQFPVGIFSMEMSKQQIIFKIMADLAKTNTQKFKSGFFTRDEWIQLSAASSRIHDSPIFIDDNNALTIHEIRRRSRQMWKQNKIKLIIVDYIQLMSGSGNQQNRDREISDIANGLKNLAKELEIPVIGVSQLNRKVEDRNDKRPHMADLRDSGSIEQAADVIAFIYRDEVYNTDDNNPLKGTADIIISKNRTGPTGVARLAFIDKFASFYNLAMPPSDDHY
uniref:DNA 5'-3' helicase n=1 Tax=viral metagenome TaxID=1070528 RepID=A0A6M3IMV0_9ZZZZ